jgi:predicted oxidoreductase
MNDWYQLRAMVPTLGNQFIGWLYTDSFRAVSLVSALRTCPGIGYFLVDKNGNEIKIPSFPGFPF